MMYYFIISTPILLVIMRLLLTNKLIPYFKRASKKEALRGTSNWSQIEQKIQTLELAYNRVNSKSASRWYRLRHWIQDKAFIYGEIDFLSFYTLLERTYPSEQDVFYDLGSGAGKAVFSAMLFFNIQRAIGIELLPPLYHQSYVQLNKLKQQFDGHHSYHAQLQRIQFMNNSFLHVDFSDADIIYIAATCLLETTWNELISKMTSLKSGCRVIVATRTIAHEQFELIYEGVELMSWGLCPVRIYKKKPGSTS